MRIIDSPSPNHGPRRDGATVDMVVMHYTGMRSAEESLARMRDPASSVSAHYLIDTDGVVHRLVDEERRAWHAGVAYWRGVADVNSRSIGIELQNLGHEHGYAPFPEAQIEALTHLSNAILSRHAVTAAGIVGHSDVAPDRKTDPGELFPWALLADAGIGAYPRDGIDTDRPLDVLLTEIGYDPDAVDRIAAFQRRFRPNRIDNAADRDCARRAAAYLEALENHAAKGAM
jgi:N-acetylmuramoyl-L-alanine amidase